MKSLLNQLVDVLFALTSLGLLIWDGAKQAQIDQLGNNLFAELKVNSSELAQDLFIEYEYQIGEWEPQLFLAIAFGYALNVIINKIYLSLNK